MKVLISTGSALKTYDYAASFSSSNNTEPDELVLQSSVACVPSCVVMHPDGNKYLTVARATNQLVVWDKEGKRICVLKRSDTDSKQPIVSPAFLERQSVVFASGSTSYIYQPSSSAAPTSYTGHPTGSIVTTLALNSDHTAFATGSNQGTLLVHNLTTHSQSTLHCKPKAPYTVLAYHPTRRTFLVAATSTGVIHLHDTTKPSAPLRSFTLDTSPLPSPINALAFSAVSSLLLACTSAGRLYFVDTATMKVLPTTIEVGAEVDQGGMQMEGKLVWFRGVKGVRLLDLKRREKGVRELNVCEGKDRVAGMAIQQSSGSSKKAAPPSTTKASGVLQDSLNRMRAAKHDATLQEAPTLGSIAEMFSPVKFSRPAYEQSQSGTDMETESEDDQVPLPRRQAFADAIRQDPRASTTTRSTSAPVPPTVLRTSFVASTPTLSTSRSRPRTSIASVPSPSLSTLLPSMSLTPTFFQSRTPRADTAASTYRGGPSPAGTNLTVNTTRSSGDSERTIGEIERRLVLPELEVTEVFVVPVPVREKAGERKTRNVGFAGGSVEKVRVTRAITPLREDSPESEEEQVEVEEEVKRGSQSGGELMKAAIKEVMEEFQSRTSREIQNLHLEIIRQSFAQKKEMKSLHAVLLELKQDNARLKDDNARLRRGY